MKLIEVIQSLPSAKNKNSSVWVRLVIRPFSHLVTYPLVNLNISANTVTIFSFFVCGLMIYASYFSVDVVAYNLLLHFWLVLDCVDGNLARIQSQRGGDLVKQKPATSGEFVDALYGYVYVATLFPTLGLLYVSLNEAYSPIFLFLSGLIPVFHLFSSLISNKYNYLVAKGEESSDRKTKNLFHYFYRIDKNIGISGFMLPIITVCTLQNSFHYLIAGYFLYYLSMALLLLVIFTLKVVR